MFEPAGLFGDFFFVFHLEGMCEENFRQTMTANDVFCSPPAFFREDDHPIAVYLQSCGRTESNMAAIQDHLVRMRIDGVVCEVNQPQALHSLQRQRHWQ